MTNIACAHQHHIPRRVELRTRQRPGGEHRALSALGVTLLLVGVGGVVPWERRRRRLEREAEERQERDRALDDLFHGEDMLDDLEPDDWTPDTRDDGPYAVACDALFSKGESTWFPGRSCCHRVPVEVLGRCRILEPRIVRIARMGHTSRVCCARALRQRAAVTHGRLSHVGHDESCLLVRDGDADR